MQDDIRTPEPPLEGAPTWVRIVEAAIVGVIAGFALHALLSVVVLQGKDLWPSRNGTSECRKSSPTVIKSAVSGARS
jgi:hypothetical protein